MTQSTLKFLTALFVVLFVALPASGQVEPDSVRENAWRQFQAQHGSEWQVRWNAQAGTPRTVTAGTTEPYPGPSQEAAQGFLSEHRHLFGMEPGLPDLKLQSTRRLREVTHVRFQQNFEGLPVYDTEYLVHLRQDGRVIMANGIYYPDIDVPTSPDISERTAQRIAFDHLGDRVVREGVESTLTIYPQEGQFHLAWKLIVPLAPNGGWKYLVDAQTGTVLQRYNLLVDATGDGKVYPKHPYNSSLTVKDLYRLDGTGYLRGTYANVVNDSNGISRAYEPSLSFQYSPTNPHFDEVNLYYHVDRFRNDFIEGLEDPNNSLGFTQIAAHAHATYKDGNGNLRDDNAWFNRIDGHLYFGDARSRTFINDFAKEDKVIYHEYSHAVIYDQNSGIESVCKEEGAISEGIPDYFAGSFTGRALLGEYVGISRDMSNPDIETYSDYVAAGGTYPQSLCPNHNGVQEHDGGEYFSAILWDLRNDPDISTGQTDELVYSGPLYVSSAPTFLEYREAMITEDNSSYGGQHTCDIVKAFSDRGVGQPIRVVLSGPASLDSGEQGTWNTSVECGSGSTTYDWAYLPPGSSTWTSKSCTGSACSHTFFNNSNAVQFASIRATVTKGTDTVIKLKIISVSPSCGSTICSSATSEITALRSLQARGLERGTAELTWTTPGSVPSSRFLVHHRPDSTASWTRIGTVQLADSVRTDGKSGPAYRFETDRLEVGTHQFRLASASPEGAKSAPWTSTVVTAEIQLNGAFELSAYPNPVRDRATVELAVQNEQAVTVAVYDVLGRRVATLHDGPLAAHEQHQLSLETGRLGLPSGTYFIRARGEHFRGTRRLTVVR